MIVDICEDIRCRECLTPTVIDRLQHVTVFRCSRCHRCVAVMATVQYPCMFCGRTDVVPDAQCPWGCALRNPKPPKVEED
jgi:hypothetical protein